MSKPMGENQIGCLRALQDKGPYPGMWVWDTHSGTRRIMESLVRRGFVTATEREARRTGETYTEYEITTNGRAALEIVKGTR